MKPKPTVIEKEKDIFKTLKEDGRKWRIKVRMLMYQDLKSYGYTADELLVESIKELNE